MNTPYQFAVSPDFSPERLPGWYIFNTWLQRRLQRDIHLALQDSFEAMRQAIRADQLDLVYANPFDASLLVREKGFHALARPSGHSDEAIVLVSADRDIQRIEDLRPGTRIAATDVPDIETMGMILLEPADLDRENTERRVCGDTISVARHLIQGDADVGFILAEAYDDFSDLLKRQLRPLVRSDIQVIHHSLMAAPRLIVDCPLLLPILLDMRNDAKGREVVEALGFHGWSALDDEDTEFMIDLMDTLLIKKN